MVNVSRYIVERGTDSKDQVLTALRAIAPLCKTHGITHVTLIVPKKGGWEHSVVAEVLGPSFVKALSKGHPVNVTPGVTMALESTQTFRSSARDGLLVGAHVSATDMNRLDNSWSAQAIMYLPWNESEEQEWRATWQPETIGPQNTPAPANTSLSAPVEEALKRLTDDINLSTGLGHPLDKKKAEQTFDRLRSKGHAFDPAEVRRWAQRHHWSSSAAADLEKVAQKRM